MANRLENEVSRLDDAARAGWLYYVAGNTQDEIARKLGVSRQSAQRLVSLAVSERLIKVRLDHPIAQCMELAEKLTERFGLRSCEVVPSDPDAPNSIAGLAQAGAAEMERYLKSSDPKILAFGTGRALRASVEQLPHLNCPQHSVVSLLGNMLSDGSASGYNAVIRIADRVNARHFPMPLPVLTRSKEELDILHAQEPVANILDLAARADVTFVGIGDIADNAPMAKDGFVTRDDMRALIAMGAVGEIISWAYDSDGTLLDERTGRHVASAPLVVDSDRPVFGMAAGLQKSAAILGALRGKLINALITNETTAEDLLRLDGGR